MSDIGDTSGTSSDSSGPKLQGMASVYHPFSGEIHLFDQKGAELETPSRMAEIAPLLTRLNSLGGDLAVLKFSVWCAQSVAKPHPGGAEFVEAANRFLQRGSDRNELDDLYQEKCHVSMAAGTIGLKIGDPAAAGYLAAFACLRPNYMMGATSAASMLSLSYQLFHVRREEAGTTRALPATRVAVNRLIIELERRIDLLKS